MAKLIDVDALLEAMRGGTQSPRAAELVIQRLESGEFDAEASKAKDKASAEREPEA